ncbi:MAG: hypothetical protein NTV44_02600 [Firmicutes bacterium]|nr:hypothetical protein [Bacillota bacterium]
MRRLIAYITLSVAVLLGIAINAGTVVTKSNANLEFSDGKQFVYRISDPEDETGPLPTGTVDDIAQTMISRLETAGVNKYNVETEGENQVRVTLAENSSTAYDRIKEYLAYNGVFSICTTKDTCAVGDEMFKDSTARIEYNGQYPVVVIPLSDPTKFVEQIVSEAQTIQGDSTTTTGNYDNSTTSSTTADAMILLWANKSESDTYEASLTDTKIADKILLKFDYTRIWFSNAKTEICSAVSPAQFGTADKNNKYPVSAVTQANDLAAHYVRLFNASALSFNVDFLFEVAVTAEVESLISLNRHATIAFSRTMLAILIGLLIVFAGVIVFYRLSGLAAIATTSLSLFVALIFYNLVGMEITGAAIIGMLAVVALGIASAFLYFSKLKNEVYKGRGLKKANNEASKRSLWPTIDLSVVAFLFSLVAYFLGGPMVKCFSIMVVFGSLANLLFVLTGLKGLMWLLTNTVELQDKLHLFGIDKTKVPNNLNEEKQNYFGRFAEVDFTKKASKVALGASIVTVAGVALMLILGLTGKSIFASTPSSVDNGRIYFEVLADRSDIDSTAYVEDKILAHLTVDGAPIVYTTVSLSEMTKTVEEVAVDYRFYVVELDKKLTGDEPAVFDDTVHSYNGTLSEVLNDIVFGIDADTDVSTVSVKPVTSLISQPNIAKVALAVSIGLIAASFYLFLRYRLSRGLAALAVAALSSFITLAFFALTRIPVTAPISLSILLVGLFALILSVIIFNKERELIKDEKDKIKAKEIVNSLGVKSVALTATPVLALTFLVAYFGINFFGFGPSAYATMFAAVTLGIVLSALFATSLLMPMSVALAKLFGKIGINFKLPESRRGRARSEKKAAKVKTGEPQEAVFIGIND